MNSKSENKPISIATLRDIASFIKNEPWSVLIIISLVAIPVVFSLWKSHFPEPWRLSICLIIITAWIIALLRRRKEKILLRRKTILFNYLKKHKRLTKKRLSTESDWKKELTEKNIEELLLVYPDVFRRVTIKRDGGKNFPGVTLVKYNSERKLK